MASNTEILIKRSLSTDKPSSLLQGELAYSYSSNTMFIGSSDGLGTLNVGGQFYTSQVDNATDLATGNALVRRDPTGNATFNWVTANYFAGSFKGTADDALKLTNARDFSIDGLDVESSTVSFDGTSNVILQGNLKTTGVSAGTYGGETQIPVITVDDKGRLSYAANVSIATTLSIAGDVGGPNTVDLLTQTLEIAGGEGITSTVSGQTITLDVDTTVVRSNTAMLKQTIDGDVEISGNLIVTGNVTTIDVQTLNVADPLIYLASNNYTSDVVDIGFVGNYFDGSTQRHAGVYRHAGDQQFYIFDNYDQEPTDDLINPADASFRLATLHANLTSYAANVDTILTLGAGSQLYANGGAYFAGTPYLYGGALLEDYLVLNSGNHIQLNTADNTSAVDLYNSGNTGVNLLHSNSSLQLVGDLFVSNRVYGDTSNNTLVLAPSTNYGPGVNDQYIIVDPTAPNHIHLRAGGTIDSSTADLYLGGENTHVMVSDSIKTTYIRANSHSWAFNNDASTEVPGELFAANLPNATTLNLVYYDTANGRFSYANDNALTPTSIANGSYYLEISDTDGTVSTNGAGFLLTNGARIKDTAGDAIAFGQNAGTLSQGSEAVAIGDSAGYNSQGAYAVAIGNGAGNVNQGQTSIAIGLNAGISNQGHYGIAIGNSSGNAQGQYGIAIGYDTGGQQGQDSIAIGTQAGKGNTTAIGVNTITIGKKAGFESAAANSIIFNASDDVINSSTSGLFINPIRYTVVQDSTNDGIMFYNQSTKEVRYSYALDGGSF